MAGENGPKADMGGLEALKNETVDLEHIPIEEVFAQLRCTHGGLTDEEAEARLLIFGHNKLEEKSVSACASICVCPFEGILSRFAFFVSGDLVWIFVFPFENSCLDLCFSFKELCLDLSSALVG